MKKNPKKQNTNKFSRSTHDENAAESEKDPAKILEHYLRWVAKNGELVTLSGWPI